MEEWETYIQSQEKDIISKLKQFNINVLPEAKKHDDLIKNIISVLKKNQHKINLRMERFPITDDERNKLKSKLNRMFKKTIKHYTKKKVLE